MRVFVSTNEKGGVGKTAVADQFAWYLEDVAKQRVLVLDFDQQGDASRPLKKFACNLTASQLFTDPDVTIKPNPTLTLVPADRELRALEGERQKHGQYAKNLKRFIDKVQDQFDFCVIDCPPDPGVRMTAALVVGNFVVSPIELAQESVEGVANLLARIQGVKTKYNEDLVFLGLLPNRVKPTPLQKEWFATLVTKHKRFMVEGMLKISERSAIAEAQQTGVPVWKLDKTAARDAGKELKAVFAQFVESMGGING